MTVCDLTGKDRVQLVRYLSYECKREWRSSGILQEKIEYLDHENLSNQVDSANILNLYTFTC